MFIISEEVQSEHSEGRRLGTGSGGLGCSSERTVRTRKTQHGQVKHPHAFTTHSAHTHARLFSPAYRLSAHLAAAVFKSLRRRKLHGLNLRPAISLLSRALLL